ncbi:MAG: helix-turn-helix transcriptional regulator [Phycisphaeraceae bacterium]|nr:helix-turn-helix transcriptional regulator [Phycisphaeraceae bacterium]
MHDGKVMHNRTSLTVLPPGAWFEEIVGEKEDWIVQYLTLEGDWAKAFCRDWPPARGGMFIRYDPAPRVWRDDLRACVQLGLDQPRNWTWSFARHLSALLHGILAAPLPVDRSANLIERMTRVVESDPFRAWSVPQLAEALDMPTSTLAHQFRAIAGQPPAQWVCRHRIDRARQLLSQGLGVAEVADRLGFANPYHFSRVFKAVSGRTPSSLIPGPDDVNPRGQPSR